jgi:tellurite resistance-related uncharacterized protein
MPAQPHPVDRPALPDGLTVVRTTPVFDTTTTPPGLRAAHTVAEGVWGRIRVLDGGVTFVFEEPGRTVVELDAGDELAIPPGRRHHVEPGPEARFEIDFLR